MFIKEFRITNFKSFKDVTFHFNRDINIFTGVNNAGKTTAIEALSLWVECFLKLCRQAERADNVTGLVRGDFRLGYKKQNYFEKLTSVHLTHHRDLFFQLDHRHPVRLLALLDKGDTTLNLGFEIHSRGIQYEINLMESDFDYPRFNAFFRHLPRAVNAAYARPVAYLEPSEEFITIPKIHAMEDAHRGLEVTRNRIFQLMRDDNYRDFRHRLSYILTDQPESVFFTVTGDLANDVTLRIMVKIGRDDTPKELALLGSGSLQIITILLGCYVKSVDLNLILLDEPDSHIHRNIQQRLLFSLQQFSQQVQVFLTTHNESLIRAADPRFLFHLVQNSTNSYKPLAAEPLVTRKNGFQPRPEWTILRSLGNSSALDFVSALESDRLYLVEGADDAVHLDILLPKGLMNYRSRHMFWSCRGVTTVMKDLLAYQKMFSLIHNEKTLWQKSILIIDKDCMTDEQRISLIGFLAGKLGIPVHAWSAYTFEALLLQSPDKLARMLGQYLQTLESGVIENLLKQEIQRQRDLLRDQVESEAYMKRVYHELRDRRQHLCQLGNEAKNLLPQDGEIQPRFRDYALRNLTAGRIDHLATKETVMAVIEPILQHFNHNPGEFVFSELIQCVDAGSWIPEWSTALFPP